MKRWQWLTGTATVIGAIVVITGFATDTFGWRWPPWVLPEEVKKVVERVDRGFEVAADERRKNRLEALRNREAFEYQILQQTENVMDQFEAQGRQTPGRIKRRFDKQKKQYEETRSQRKALER